ncbi:TPA: phage repressor protein, partial [Clostridioides difficile]|nr:phage repressor protein [Clostridioides difficile]HCU3136880.1 phage repressor protein [Clostridioides difficile]
MKNLIVKEFNGSQIYTFMWKEKSCWIANQIVGLFDYADVSKTIQDCIKAEDFEIEQEYDVLKGNEFNDFVTTLNVVANNIISNKARS